MLRYFRQIRKTLMEQSKIRTYLFYAVGEIVLVMVGILLALQVNNWNEERKSDHLEHKLLTNIAVAVASDTTGTARNIRLFSRIEETAIWLREQLETRAPYIDRMDTAFAAISIFSINSPNYSAFDNLESVGIATISNDSLRNEILHYYNEYREIVEVDEYFEINKFYREEIYPKYFRQYRYGSLAVPVDKGAIYENSEIRVVIDYSINDAIFYKNRIRHMKETAEHLLHLIDQELN